MVPVPKEAVPCPTNLLVQISSIGQDSNATAEPPAQEYPADGEQTLLNFFHIPLWLIWSIKGFIFLCPTGPYN